MTVDNLDIQPPSVFLPPLKHIKACSNAQISEAISCLRNIYLPEVRGSTRRRHVQCSYYKTDIVDSVSDSYATVGIAKRNSNTSNAGLEEVRADTFERSFAIQWLTRFISLFSEADEDSQGPAKVGLVALEEAASLLAICAGATASGAVTRTFKFSLTNSDNVPDQKSIMEPKRSPAIHRDQFTAITGLHRDVDEISVILRDAPLESADFTSVGAQTWGGSCVLAEMIAENPRSFGIFPIEDIDSTIQEATMCTPFRALELGAGTGLASLVLGKTIEHIRGSHRHFREHNSSNASGQSADTLVATDFHPSVLANLRVNIAVNFPAQATDDRASVPNMPASSPHVVVLPLDWSLIHGLSYTQTRPLPHNTGIQFSDEPQTRYQSAASHPGQRASCDGADLHPTEVPIYVVPPPLHTPFDLIIGADIIYEPLHARWVRSCVERFLRKPTHPSSYTNILTCRLSSTTVLESSALHDASSSIKHRGPPPALFHLIIPLRRTHAVESRSVEEVFSQAADVLSLRRGQGTRTTSQPSNTRRNQADCDLRADSHRPITPCAGPIADIDMLELAIISQEDILCDAYSDREEAEEVVYRYYKIGWV